MTLNRNVEAVKIMIPPKKQKEIQDLIWIANYYDDTWEKYHTHINI